MSVCLDLPLYDICHKVYHLSSKYCVALTESASGSVFCQLHIKLIEKDTRRALCLDKVLLIELFHQLRQFEKVNVEYPCTSERNYSLTVKETTIPGEYQIKFRSNKFNLDPITVKVLLAFEGVVLEQIKKIENHSCVGRDEADF